MTPMTIEELDRFPDSALSARLARLIGWTCRGDSQNSALWFPPREKEDAYGLPDYAGSLDLTAFVELSLDSETYQEFQGHIVAAWFRVLHDNKRTPSPLSASARQRTIALIMTLQK